MVPEFILVFWAWMIFQIGAKKIYVSPHTSSGLASPGVDVQFIIIGIPSIQIIEGFKF